MAIENQLERKAGWFSIAVLGISYVISGDYAGWNPGLSNGFSSFVIAYCLVALFYLGLGLCMSELSASLPAAGGGYTFARTAMGKFGGYMTGVAVLSEYTLTAAAIGTFTGAYFNELVKHEIPIYATLLVLYTVCISIHIVGVGEALKLLLVVTGIAVVGLALSLGGSIANFDGANLRNSTVDFMGVWSSIPWATWFFLAIEGVPLAAEEALVPERDVPRGLWASWVILFIFGFSTTICITGSMGETAASLSDSPLVDSVNGALSSVVNVVGLFGLLASFFSVIYGYSRLTFALARAGFVPRLLETTNARHSPWMALIVPGVIGYALTFVASGSDLLQAAVCSAATSYTLVLTSFLILRFTQPQLRRPYRVKLGLCWASLSLILSVVIVIAAFISNWVVSVSVIGLFAVASVYYALYARHKVIKEDDIVPTGEVELLQGSGTHSYATQTAHDYHTNSYHSDYLKSHSSHRPSELITRPENAIDPDEMNPAVKTHTLSYHDPLRGSSTSISSTAFCTTPVH